MMDGQVAPTLIRDILGDRPEAPRGQTAVENAIEMTIVLSHRIGAIPVVRDRGMDAAVEGMSAASPPCSTSPATKSVLST